MGLNGYYLKPNFFTGETQTNEITFYLTDGGRTGGNIMRIKDVFVSIDMDTQKAFLVVPEAYGKKPFFAEYHLQSNIGGLHKAFQDIKEWLGYIQQWRKVGRTDKTCTIITIEDGKIDTIDVLKGEPQ